MQRCQTQEQQILGVCLIVLGAALASSATVFALEAARHMAVAATLCGPATRHCVLCVASGVSLFASVGASAAGVMLLGACPSRLRSIA